MPPTQQLKGGKTGCDGITAFKGLIPSIVKQGYILHTWIAK